MRVCVVVVIECWCFVLARLHDNSDRCLGPFHIRYPSPPPYSPQPPPPLPFPPCVAYFNCTPSPPSPPPVPYIPAAQTHLVFQMQPFYNHASNPWGFGPWNVYAQTCVPHPTQEGMLRVTMTSTDIGLYKDGSALGLNDIRTFYFFPMIQYSSKSFQYDENGCIRYYQILGNEGVNSDGHGQYVVQGRGGSSCATLVEGAFWNNLPDYMAMFNARRLRYTFMPCDNVTIPVSYFPNFDAGVANQDDSFFEGGK